MLGAATALGLSGGGGAGSAKPTASASATATPTASRTATPAALTERQAVDRIAAILDFSAIGHQERVAGHFNAALKNRRESLRRVQALERQTHTLDKDLRLLETAARASLKAVQAYIACGGAHCAPTETQAALHAKLAFAASFNPLARRYLQRSYTPSDF
jgi:hypothetical protein